MEFKNFGVLSGWKLAVVIQPNVRCGIKWVLFACTFNSIRDLSICFLSSRSGWLGDGVSHKTICLREEKWFGELSFSWNEDVLILNSVSLMSKRVLLSTLPKKRRVIWRFSSFIQRIFGIPKHSWLSCFLISLGGLIARKRAKTVLSLCLNCF